MYKKDVINKLLYEIYYLNNNALEIQSNNKEKSFGLSYNIAKRYAEATNREYFFGMDLVCTDYKSFLKLFKELLKIKRYLKTL